MFDLNKKKLIIFDMDGCLVDSEKYYSIGWKQVFKKNNLAISDQEVESWVGLGGETIDKKILEHLGNGFNVQEIRAQREAYFYECLDAGVVTLKPGVIEILNYLRERNIPTAVASSTVRYKGTRILEYHNLLNHFDYLVFGDEVSATKPAPDLFLKVLKQANVQPKDALIFEDSENGVIAAHRSGVECFYIPDLIDTTFPQEYKVKRITSFMDVLEGE